MPLNAEKLRTAAFAPVVETYTRDRTILYALGLGVGRGPKDLDFVFEKRLKALPMLAVVLANDPPWMTDPAYGVTFTHVLHGEQDLEVFAPIPPQGTVVAQTSIEGLFDKGDKGAVIVIRRDLRDEGGALLAVTRATAMARRDGGFGGAASGAPEPHPLPDRPPDHMVRAPTRDDLALTYRLSGDFNPLHVDPELALAAGFPRPILHGLCSYGIAGKSLLDQFCAGDPARVRRLKARFSTPVYPGETLSVEAWREAAGQAAFRVRVVERDVIALNNGLFVWDHA